MIQMTSAALSRVSTAGLLIGLMAMCGCKDRPADAMTMAERKPAAVPLPVAETVVDAGGTKQPFTTTGPLVAEQQADVAAEREGRIVEVAVQIGDRVEKGQLLARMDDRALHAACDAAKAKVASLSAQVKEWEAEQKSEEADLRRADAMLKEKIRSEEDWEHVKYKLDEAMAEVTRYRADEAAAEAEQKSAELMLEQSRMVAPFAGVVGRSSVRISQEVKKGDVLLWVTAVAPLRVLFTVPEAEMALFPIGAGIELKTADYPALRQEAKVLRVSPVVDPASGSVQVIGMVVHPSLLLKPGMTMQIAASAKAHVSAGK
jgi:RND family efflux transporter MFP subunit